MIDLKAVSIAGFIVLLCGIDVVFNGGHVVVFLLKKLMDLVAFLMFWHH